MKKMSLKRMEYMMHKLICYLFGHQFLAGEMEIGDIDECVRCGAITS